MQETVRTKLEIFFEPQKNGFNFQHFSSKEGLTLVQDMFVLSSRHFHRFLGASKNYCSALCRSKLRCLNRSPKFTITLERLSFSVSVSSSRAQQVFGVWPAIIETFLDGLKLSSFVSLKNIHRPVLHAV